MAESQWGTLKKYRESRRGCEKLKSKFNVVFSNEINFSCQPDDEVI